MSSYYSSNLRVLVGELETVKSGEPMEIPVMESSENQKTQKLPTAFDVRIWNPTITPIIEADDEGSKYATGDHGEDESIMGAQSATIEFSVKMSSRDPASGYPAWWKFAQACGCEVKRYPNNEPPATAVGYSLQPLKSRDVSTMTIFVYDIPRTGGKIARYKFSGCMGNMTIGAEGVGKPWTANFSFTGKLVGIDNAEATPELSIADKTVAEKMLNYELNFHGLGLRADRSQKISTFMLDVGNEISPLIDQADPTGYAYYAITKRSPRFSCDPLMNGSFETLFNAWKNNETFSVVMRQKDGNGFTLRIPKAQQLTSAVASREGLINWDLNLKALRNNNDDTAPEEQEVTWELIVGTKPDTPSRASPPVKKAAKKAAKKA